MMDQNNTTDLSHADRFFRAFQLELAEISERIERLESGDVSGSAKTNDIDQCQANITQLSNGVRDASSYIPAHDKRIYSEGIKGLQQKLKDTQASVAPRPKFSFKSTKSKFAAKKVDLAIESAVEQKSTSPEVADPSNGLEAKQGGRITKDPTQSQQPVSSQNQPFIFSNQNGERAFFETLSSSANLSQLRHCVINLKRATTTTEPFANLTLKNIQESLVICSQVDGPVYLTDISNSVIVVSSRQFRMHESRNCDIYLATTSRPIIENCSNIRFAPLPDTFKTGTDEKTESQWQYVDDFNWHRSEPSPNWSILEASERVTPDIWRRVVSKEEALGAEDALNAVSLPGRGSPVSLDKLSGVDDRTGGEEDQVSI